MSTPIPDPAVPAEPVVDAVEDDPTKPLKAVAALLAPAVLAFLQALLDDGGAFLPPWALLLVGAFASAVAVYVTTNPKRIKRRRAGRR